MKRTFAFIVSLFAFVPQIKAANIYINTVGPSYNGLNDITPNDLVKAAINLALGFAGVLAFLYLLWGGIQWVTAGGDKDALERSRKKITHALIGLALVFSAYALLSIISMLFGVDLIQFTINRV